jgi:hypothetical protein
MDPEPADLPMITPAQVERLADAAFLTNAQGTIAAWNTAATELLGHPATRAVGSRCAILLEGVRMHGAPVCTHPCLMVQGLPTQRSSRTPAHPTAHPDMVARHSDGGRLNLSVVAMAVSVDGIPMLLHLLRHDAHSEHDPLTGSLSRDASSYACSTSRTALFASGHPWRWRSSTLTDSKPSMTHMATRRAIDCSSASQTRFAQVVAPTSWRGGAVMSSSFSFLMQRRLRGVGACDAR